MREPRIPKKSVKHIRLVVYISPEQHEAYRRAAARDVRILSDWVRLLLDTGSGLVGMRRVVGQ